MVGTILPIVYGEKQKPRARQNAVLWIHTGGYLAGSVIIGSLLGLLGFLLPWHRLPVVPNVGLLVPIGTISLVYAAHELGLIKVPTPQSRWQVPQRWRTQLHPKVTALSYGLGLGSGFATAIPVTTFYVVVAWTLIVGNPLLGALGLAAFGLGRALPLLWMAWLFRISDDAFRLARVMSRWQPVMHFMNGLALSSAGSGLLIAGLVRH
jgi:cytochrome c biogenesis protein CcdA